MEIAYASLYKVIAKNNKLNCDNLVTTNNKNKKHAKDWIGSLKESRL
jgi:hypothetical protein